MKTKDYPSRSSGSREITDKKIIRAAGRAGSKERISNRIK